VIECFQHILHTKAISEAHYGVSKRFNVLKEALRFNLLHIAESYII